MVEININIIFLRDCLRTNLIINFRFKQQSNNKGKQLKQLYQQHFYNLIYFKQNQCREWSPKNSNCIEY